MGWADRLKRLREQAAQHPPVPPHGIGAGAQRLHNLAHPHTEPPPVPVIPRPRRGLVRCEGRNWRDDDGFFSPLGCTWFTALHWHHFDRDKFKKQAEWIRDQRFDAVRVFSVVGFKDAEVDNRWPEYDADLIAMIETLYHDYGLRTELCVFAGRESWFTSDAELEAHARRIVGLLQGRQHMILNLETCNEAFQNLNDWALIARLTRILATAGVPLVGASNQVTVGDHNDRSEQQQAVASMAWGATLGIIHPDRVGSDGGLFEVSRVMRPWWSAQIALTANENTGPGASVTWETDPAKLVALRANAIVNGVGAWVFHTGAGVDSQHHVPREGDPYHVENQEYLQDEPNADAIATALRALDTVLPEKPCDGVSQELHVEGAYCCYLVTHNEPAWWGVLTGASRDVSVPLPRQARVTVFGEQLEHLWDGVGRDIPVPQGTVRILRGVWLEPSPMGSVPAPVTAFDHVEASWRQYLFALIDTLQLGPIATVAALDALEPLIAVYGGEWQRNMAHEYRGRLFLPSETSDPYANAVDVGLNEPWQWKPV